MGGRFLSLKFVATVVVTAGLLVLGYLNIEQKRVWVVPEDGCSWIQTLEGVQVRAAVREGGCYRAGVRVGDILKAINEQRVLSDQDVTQILYETKVWNSPTYTLQRDGREFKSTPVVITPLNQRLVLQRLFLEIIGIYYVLVGGLVLIKRRRAPHATHFYYVCLVSFVLFAYSYTGKLNSFDWAVFWFDTAASALLPPLFLHFCLEFSLRKSLLQKSRRMLLLLYAPGGALMVAWAAFVFNWISPTLTLRETLDVLSDLHFGGYLVLSAGVLFWTSRTVRTPELRQQMKWVTRGVALGVVPFFVLISLPQVMGIVPDTWVAGAIFPLMLIPTSFGYAIDRYKLVDVDIIFKRGVTYTLATAAVVTVIVLVGEFFGSNLERVGTVARVGVTILAALLFSPIKDQFQVWLDKLFYGERYNVRHTLVDFGRTLGSEVRSENMLDRIADRLHRAFSVDRAAIFLESPQESQQFAPAFVTGLQLPMNPDFSFLKGSTDRPYLFLDEDVFGLNYFIPCRVKDRVIAYIGLGQTQKGDYLNSEDIELLEAMSDYVGIALENARLYKSLEQRAAEYQDLKDFSENIIESINVGVVVENVAGRIAGWNKALEDLTGLGRSEAMERRTGDVIPADFLHRLSEHRYLYKQQWKGLTVNFSITSLLDKAGATRGRVIIIDDITDRVRLEDQLVQNEKLTSIGLLAAGVAHEVNTPLAVISSYSQMLRKQLGPDHSGHKLLEKITGQTFRASEIVNSLLSFSRTHATEFSEVDIHRVIGETLSLLEHPLKTSRVDVRQALLARVPITTGNAGKLQQVFLNLFLNARDAMPDGGVLEVRTCIVDARIEIVVTDSGSGISRDNIKKIYDPFFTTKTTGLGIGLSIVRRIIQDHGGEIEIGSNDLGGAEFRITWSAKAEGTA